MGRQRKVIGDGRVGQHSIVSYSRPSLMIIALASQFHVYLPWGPCLFSLVSYGAFNQEKALVGVFPVIGDCENRLWNRWIVCSTISNSEANIETMSLHTHTYLSPVLSAAWAEFSFWLKFTLERRPDLRKKYSESSFKSSMRAYTLKRGGIFLWEHEHTTYYCV